MKKLSSNYFLPYQNRWLNDKSKYKVWEKSRRIGATYVQSYEDVTDCITNPKFDVWFSSADLSAAKEYIRYCENWVKVLKIAAKKLGIVVIDKEDDIKAHVIEFSNGSRIHALSSNPKQFRSKGGKVVLDEFAHHDNPVELWMAAQPCTTWQGQLRILSTHNGQNCKFFEFVDQIKSGQLKWSLHSTPIQLAVDEGFIEKVENIKTTQEEREAWLEEKRIEINDTFAWQQEYCCIAIDEATAFLPYILISSCEADNLLMDLSETTGDLFVGMDIGRVNNPSIIWIVERLGLVHYTRLYEKLEDTQYFIQEERIFSILRHKNVRRCCIDASGLGGQLAENAERFFGKLMVEGIKFSLPVKEELAYNLRKNFDNRTIYIPSEQEIREDLHSVICGYTKSKHIRLDVEKTDSKSHADRFWALALALHAAKNSFGELKIKSSCRRMMPSRSKGFWKKPNWKAYHPDSYPGSF